MFGNTLENVRKHRDIKLVTNKGSRSHLVSDPSYYTRKCFSESLPAKWAYLGLSVLDIIKIAMHEYWYLIWLHKTRAWQNYATEIKIGS